MKVKELLTYASKWTQGAEVETNDRTRFAFYDKETLEKLGLKPCKFCLRGALVHCYGLDEEFALACNKVLDAIKIVSKGKYIGSIPRYNDAMGRSFSDIQKVLELADV